MILFRIIILILIFAYNSHATSQDYEIDIDGESMEDSRVLHPESVSVMINNHLTETVLKLLNF
jgi:hypothetical protein